MYKKWPSQFWIVSAPFFIAFLLFYQNCSTSSSPQNLAQEGADSDDLPIEEEFLEEVPVTDLKAAEVSEKQRDDWNFPILMDEVRPLVRSKSLTLRLIGIKNYRWGKSWNIFDKTGGKNEKVGRFSIYTKSGRLVVSLESDYQMSLIYGVSFAGDEIKLLNKKMSTPPTGVSNHFYPYSWVQRHPTHLFVESDLMLPGVQLGNLFLVNDSQELYMLKIDNRSHKKTAIFLKNRELNSKGKDKTSLYIPVSANGVSEFQIEAAKSLPSLLAKRAGTSKAISGIMTQMPMKGWASEREESYLTDAEYRRVAQVLARGRVKHVVLRLNSPKPHIAAIFRQEGVIPHFYQFLAASKVRRVNGQLCYSLIFDNEAVCVEEGLLKDSKGNVVTCAANDAWGMMDLRKSEYEKMLIQSSVEVIRNGYAGIFFDGNSLQPSSDGTVGGSTPGALKSWHFARSEFFRKLIKAVELENPRAIVGSITNAGGGFFDYQNYGDYVAEEVANWIEPIPEDPRLRRVVLPEKTLPGMVNRARYIHTNFYLNAKGSDVDQLKTFHSLVRSELDRTVNIHLDAGDFLRTYYLSWAQTISNTADGLRNR